MRPVGSNQRVKVDVRIMAATNRDLEAAYEVGAFRKDLYFRLNVVTVHVPGLRERRSDIPMLVQWFLERYAPGTDLRVSNAAMKALIQYDWPGNVRELEIAWNVPSPWVMDNSSISATFRPPSPMFPRHKTQVRCWHRRTARPWSRSRRCQPRNYAFFDRS